MQWFIQIQRSRTFSLLNHSPIVNKWLMPHRVDFLNKDLLQPASPHSLCVWIFFCHSANGGNKNRAFFFVFVLYVQQSYQKVYNNVHIFPYSRPATRLVVAFFVFIVRFIGIIVLLVSIRFVFNYLNKVLSWVQNYCRP